MKAGPTNSISNIKVESSFQPSKITKKVITHITHKRNKYRFVFNDLFPCIFILTY